MHNPTIVTPRSPPESAGIIFAAGNFAHQRRHNQSKSIMDCLRDRTPNYSRSNSRNLLKPETTVVLLKDPPTRSYQHNKLALLKSASTRDLSRREFFETTSSTTSSNSSSSSQQKKKNPDIIHHCNCNELNQDRILKLEQHIGKLLTEIEAQKNINKEFEKVLNEIKQRLQNFELNPRAIKDIQKKPSIRKKQQLQQQQTHNTIITGISVQPSKFAAWLKLTNFWKQRPSIQTLKDQNIYNDEPCFDTEIESVLKHETFQNIPKIVVICCDLIEEKFRRSSEPIEGIYRQCGDYNKIQTLRFKIDGNDYDALYQPNVDIHTLTGLLKLFIREIKNPLISTNEAKTFIGKPNQWILTDLNDKIEILTRLIRFIPEINRSTMEYLFSHFNRLTKVPLQQISAEILAISIAPSIFHSVQKGAHAQDIKALLQESEVLADCVKIMIEYHARIFQCTADRKSRRISVRRLRKTLSHPDLIFQNLF